jgi:hypothetical protein
MKLRIKGNSIRFRLTKSEVSQLAEGKQVTEQTGFSLYDTLIYSVRPWNLGVIECSFKDKEILLSIPQNQLNVWATSEEVGIESVQENQSQESLVILIEKDFACLKPRADEDESDQFPHPVNSGNKC